MRYRYSQRRIKELPLIGRKDELTQLENIFFEVQSTKRRVVAIIGEAGIGKTKLVNEFKNNLPSTKAIYETKGIEYLAGTPYFVLKDLLKRIFEIDEKNNPKEMGEKIEKHLKKMGDTLLEIKLPYYKYFLGAPLTDQENSLLESMKPDDRMRLAMEAITTLLLRLSPKEPMVLIFDDCHWIDKESISFIEKFAELIGYKPILILMLYRPEFNIGRIGSLPYFRVIFLKPLPKTDILELLKKIFNCREIEENLFRFLLKKTNSIPFYVQELAIELLNNNVVAIEQGKASLKKEEFAVPRTLDEVIMARIDKLNPELRQIVNIAAVVGEEFSVKLLKELVSDKESRAQNLSTIARLDIIEPYRESGKIAADRYTFRHSIVRDVVYKALLKKEKKEFHRRIGRALEKIFKDDLKEHYDTLAHHFLLGGEEIKSVEYLMKSGERKQELYLNEEAISIFKKCLALVPESKPQWLSTIYEKLGTIYELIGNYKESLTRIIHIKF